MSTLRDYHVFRNSIIMGANVAQPKKFSINGVKLGSYSPCLSTLTVDSLQLWNPSIIADAIIFDFDANDTISLNGSGISSISDVRRLGYVLQQTTPANQPSISANEFGNTSALSLASGKSLSIDSSLGLGSGQASFFFIEKNMSGAIGAGPFSFVTGPNNGIVFQSNTGLQPYNPRASYPFNSSTGRMHLYYRPNAASGAYCYLNDVLKSSDDNTLGTYQGFVVGMRSVGSIYCTTGSVGVIVILPRQFSTDERNKLFGWAAWEKSLVSELPSDHPYKYAPPIV